MDISTRHLTSGLKHNISSGHVNQPAFSSITDLHNPGIKGVTGFDALTLVGNSSTNTLLNSAFDTTFAKNDATKFISQVNKLLPALHYDPFLQPAQISLNTNYLMYGLPGSGSVSNGKTSVTATKEGRIQVTHAGVENLTVNKEHLNAGEWQESIWKTNPYSMIPGLQDLPIPKFIPLPGRDNISNKEIISGGIRFLDPWPQHSWEKTGLARNWPPDPYTTKGPLRLYSDNTQQAILMDTNHPSCINVGKTYGVIPRALIAVNPQDSSITLAVQQQNINKNALIGLAPWIIAPIKTPANGKSLAVFPVTSKPTSNINNQNASSLPDWLKNIQDNNKWQMDSENNYIIIDPAAPGQQSKVNTNSTNWAAYAIEGSDKIIVMRSLYNHPDQFQAFIKQSGPDNKSEYLELEYTGPKVTPGNKSTVVIKWDFIPVSSLTNGTLQAFGQTGNLKNEVLQVSKALNKLINP
jgi:hypothetical protein